MFRDHILSHPLWCKFPQMLRNYDYRRRLPHLQPDNKIFFITFCTYRRWVLPPSARAKVLETCLMGNRKLFRLYGVVVMPDHAHLLLAPLSDDGGAISIAEILQAIKGASAHRINKLLNRRGRVWQEESFDRAIRNEENVTEKLNYMLGNPVRAGLVRNPLEYAWLWRETEAERFALTG
jgi:REP element-mobilizing transposase RayT